MRGCVSEADAFVKMARTYRVSIKEDVAASSDFFLRVCENWIFLTQTSFLRIRPRALSALSGLNRNHS